MKVNFGLNNENRVLLTEVLPYEMPIIIDNLAFFHNVQDPTIVQMFNDIFKQVNSWTIPFNYSVRVRGGAKSRSLSLIHPYKQKEWVELYSTYSTYMLYLCSRSPFSLRHIHEKSNCLLDEEIMEKDDLFSEGLSKIELLDTCWNKQYQSYFQYQKYNMIHKFFEGSDYLRLEQKYEYLLQTDISKCFYHIYTHSIAWAIKGKNAAKKAKGCHGTFEERIDRLMRHCNYDETNGILVGPEVSRIFAEIILQRIDIDVLEYLKKNVFLHVGTDYEIRRYVDDYYIFANSKEKLMDVKDALIDCLSAYHLDLNDSKTNITHRPFSNEKNNAKLELKALITSEIAPYLKLDDHGRTKCLCEEVRLFEKIVTCFQNITHHHSLSYSDISSFMLSLLRRSINDLCNIQGVISDSTILRALCDISFYVYSLDMHATVSHKICDIIYLLDKCTIKTETPKLARQELLGLIDRETQRCLSIGIQDRNVDDLNIETLNLLLAVDRVSDHAIGMDKVAYIFNKGSYSDVKEVDFAELNYFQIITLLYIMQQRSEFDTWKRWLLTSVMNKYKDPEWIKYAELSCLYLDIISCPYIEKEERTKLIKQAENITSTHKAQMKFSKYKKIDRWFTDWNRNRDFGQILEKKRYHFRYG